MRSFVLRLVPVLGFVAALCCGDSHSHACTGVKLKAKDGALVYGRTMEFGVDLLSTPIVIPRRYKMQGTAPEGKPGIAWEAKYAAVGMNALHIDQIIEGTNEKGLAGGVFYMPEYAQYEATTAADAPRTLAPWEVISWILTNFASVDEVRSALPGIRVAASPAPVMNFAPPAHYVVHDIQGRSLVIEYLQGKLHMYDNPTGVITNAPTFDWHLTNLNNYVSLKSLNPAPSNFDGVQLRAFGQGAGLVGLPGDFTPPSRFVRAFLFGHAALPGANGEEAAQQLFHVLDGFDIPRGSVEEKSAGGNPIYEFTSWTTANDMTNHVFYYHTADNRRVRRIELMKLDLNGGKILRFTSRASQDYEDLKPLAAQN